MKLKLMDSSISQVDSEFIMAQERLLSVAGQSEEDIKKANTTGESITKVMINIRDNLWQDRLKIYLKQRLQDQIDFYSSKSTIAKNRELFIKWGVLGVELLAFWLLLGTNFPYRVISLLVTLTAAFTGWGQLKKYRQISLSYGSVANQLKQKLSLSRHLNSESGFVVFVSDCEDYISTENSNWAILSG